MFKRSQRLIADHSKWIKKRRKANITSIGDQMQSADFQMEIIMVCQCLQMIKSERMIPFIASNKTQVIDLGALNFFSLNICLHIEINMLSSNISPIDCCVGNRIRNLVIVMPIERAVMDAEILHIDRHGEMCG